MAAQNRKESALSEVTGSNPRWGNPERKARVCKSRSEVRNTGGIISEEEAKIKAELAEEIEKALQNEIEQQISTLTRRLEELRHQTKSDISVKKPSVAKGVSRKSINGGGERKMKFKWESSLRSSSCENGSFKRRPWNENLSNLSPSSDLTASNDGKNCRCERKMNIRFSGAVASHDESCNQISFSVKAFEKK